MATWSGSDDAIGAGSLSSSPRRHSRIHRNALLPSGWLIHRFCETISFVWRTDRKGEPLDCSSPFFFSLPYCSILSSRFGNQARPSQLELNKLPSSENIGIHFRMNSSRDSKKTMGNSDGRGSFHLRLIPQKTVFNFRNQMIHGTCSEVTTGRSRENDGNRCYDFL